MIDRRTFTSAGTASLLAACLPVDGPVPPTARARQFDAKLADLEPTNGRLGAYVFDTATGQGFGFRRDERFAMCSTFKLSLAAYCLRESQAGRIDLDRELAFTAADILPASPITSAQVAVGKMPIAALIEAAQVNSDNTAANLVLRHIGGPEVLTRFWRTLGDRVTRLDSFEVELNRTGPGDVRNTTTPESAARAVAQILTGPVLTLANRGRLSDWMARSENGTKRVRAGLPRDWRAGDKPGTGVFPDMPTKINDIAVLYPPDGRPPLIVAAFFEAPPPFNALRDSDQQVLANIGRLATEWTS